MVKALLASCLLFRRLLWEGVQSLAPRLGNHLWVEAGP